eukprot:Nk52_evm46s279 gene=Nk52_evmTU46s279
MTGLDESFLEKVAELYEYAQQLAKDSGSVKSLVAKWDGLVASGNEVTVLREIIEVADCFFNAEEEIDGPFNSIILLISQLQDEAQAREISKPLLALWVNKCMEFPEICLKLASILFNIVQTMPKVQYDAFLSYVHICQKTSNVNSVLGHLEEIDSLCKQWQLELVEKRAIYKGVIDILKNTQHREILFNCRLSYLETFEDAQSGDAVLKTQFETAVSDAICLPRFFEFSKLYDLKCRNVALGSSFYSKVLDLLANGDYKQFAALLKSSQSDFKSANIDIETFALKMRLLTLGQLCEGKDRLPVPEVMEHLCISAEEVDNIIVDAISSGYMEVKIDQLFNEIVVVSVNYRKFDAKNWQNLSEKLNEWQSEVGKILGAIKNAKNIAKTKGQQTRTV